VTVLEVDYEFSASWDGGGVPRIAAVVSTFEREEFLDGLMRSLVDQTLTCADYELIVVDNGSTDGTWLRLCEMVRLTRARLAITRLPTNRGAGGGRNHGATLVRAPLVAFTDDDCVPAESWLAAMATALGPAGDVAQGTVLSHPVEPHIHGPWDHTKVITRPTPFFETCNVGYRTSAFEAVGGFDELDRLTAQVAQPAFGEDALLAWRVLSAGGEAIFSDQAIVYHRRVPEDFAQWLRRHRNLVGFPGLGNRSPVVAQWFWHHIFLARETALFDLAAASVTAAVLARRPWLVLGALPWARRRWPEAVHRGNGSRALGAVRLAQLAITDGVSLASLLEGSIRHRRLVI